MPLIVPGSELQAHVQELPVRTGMSALIATVVTVHIMALSRPNPVLQSGFERVEHSNSAESDAMTLEGSVRKTAGLIAVVIAVAVASPALLPASAAVIATVLAFILGIVTAFKPHLACYTAVPYAVLQGVFVGLVSSWYASEYGGDVVLYAVGVTTSVFVVLLMIYASGAIAVTNNFRLGVAAATLGVGAYYLFAWVVSMFGARMPLIASNSAFGIGCSLVVVAIAAMNLVMDFDFIERGVDERAPKGMEWFAAFGLLVTLVWLYLEILRLIAKLQSRRD